MKLGQKYVGHPVNVATGVVYSTHQDISIPGQVDLVWEREYTTALLDKPTTPIGPGWTTRYFATLIQEKTDYRFFTPEGDIEIFADPQGAVDKGAIIRNLGTFQELFKRDNHYIITRWDVETGEIERFVFQEGKKGETWPLTSIEDVTGQGLDLLYDRVGRLTGIQQRLEKRILLIDYTINKQISSISFLQPNNQRQVLAQYEYDKSGQLITAYNALGYADHYEYEKDSRMTREIVKDGGVFYFKYDEKGRCIKTSGLDRYDEKSFHYLDAAHWTEVTNSYGNTTRYNYLPTGQVVREIDPLGKDKQTSYDEYGRINAKTSPTGATTRYEYDEQGNRCKIVDPLGNTYLLTFNWNHQSTILTDPNGNLWKRNYAQTNRLVGTVDPLGARWTFQYNELGNLISLTNPKGDIRSFRYTDGVLREDTDWVGNPTRVEFDALGRIIAETNPLGNTFRYDYDATGNTVRIVLPDGAEFHAAYNARGDLVKLTDPVGRVTTQRFGPCRRLLERVDPNGNKVSFIWGTEPGRLDQVVNERGEVFCFFYNETDYCTKEVSFDGREHHFAYDSSGWCIQMTNGVGETIEIGRDAIGRIVSQVLPGGNIAKYEYDKLGNLIEAINCECAVRLERNIVGRIVREIQGNHWIQYASDPLGEVTRVETDLGHWVQYDLDPNGSWKSLRTADGHTMQFRRDAGGQELERWLPGGLRLDQRYDPVGRLIEQHMGRREIQPKYFNPSTLSSPSTDSLLRRAYTRDASGLVQAIDDQYSGVTQYAYDPGERLLNVQRKRGPNERFEYDVAGNLTRAITERKDGVEDEAFVYGAGNRLLKKGTTQYEYDDQGRLVRKVEGTGTTNPKTWRYEWDALDQLSSVTQPNGEVWSYGYDALGRRVRKTGPSDNVCFVWNGYVLVHEISVNKNNWTGWIFGQDSFAPLAQIKNGSIYSVIEDHLGTPQEMVDLFGRITWRLRGKAYGEKDYEVAEGISCPFRFQGQYYDIESGLHYNMFRYYDPDVGRFISQDPIGLVAGNNLYQYAPNPISWIDPWGWIAAPPALPNTPGIYTITNGNDVYVGSAGIGEQGMSDRISDPSHTKAQDLLKKPGTVVEFKEVDLGTAKDAKDRNRILRHFEQREMDIQEQKGKKLRNGPRAEAPGKNARNAGIVKKHGASEKPQKKC